MSEPKFTKEEMEARDRAAFQAADLHASGYKPKASDLEGAPHIDDWHVERHGDLICLVGLVTGHPQYRVSPRPVRTSLVIAMSESEGWARTYNRYYTLGRKYDYIRAAEEQQRVATIRDSEGFARKPQDIVEPTFDQDDDDPSLTGSWGCPS